eukprot:TRINITY_DN29441_c0_g1_i1.p1 TRINITY_DN29441_c0_g1~~TRINITY_DN29441_c0_g1_i1.p1  ORF type:complete len:1341 (-),score=173.30 TRINITY_DN29441_c0_g1_i1:107-3904(-)
MVSPNDTLPLQMMIAIARYFGPDYWNDIQQAVRNAFEADKAKAYLSIADRTQSVIGDFNVDKFKSGANGVKNDVDAHCNNDSIIATGPWHSHSRFDPGTRDVFYLDDTRDVTHLYGTEVQNWLNDHRNSTLSKVTGIGDWHNTQVIEESRPHGGGGGSCFIAGTKVLCLDVTGMQLIEKPIEGIKPGDHVVSEHGVISTVSDEMVHLPCARVTTIGFEFYDGERQRTFASEGHPFWTSNAGWCAVDEAAATSENGFMQVSTLCPGQHVYRVSVSKSKISSPFSITLEYESKRIRTITKTTSSVKLYGLHFRSGARSYHADSFLVALNYPEITYSRIMHGMARLLEHEKKEARQQVKTLSGLLAKGTQCPAIGGVFKQGGHVIRAAHSHNAAKALTKAHCMQGEYTLSGTHGRHVLRVHGGHVTLHDAGAEAKACSAGRGIRHWTDAHHFEAGRIASETHYARDGTLFAKFNDPPTVLRMNTLRPDRCSSALMQIESAGGTKSLEALHATPSANVYDVFMDVHGTQKLFATLTMDGSNNITLTPTDHASWRTDGHPTVSGMPLQLMALFAVPVEWQFYGLTATFADDFQTFAGELKGRSGEGQTDQKVKTCPIYGKMHRARPAPDALIKSPGTLSSQPLAAAACLPAWAAELHVSAERGLTLGDTPMSAELLFRLPLPNPSELYTDVMKDFMDSAYAVFPEDQAELLQISDLIKGKQVPDYLKDVVNKDANKNMLVSIITAQCCPKLYSESTRDQWKPVGDHELDIKQRVHYYLQGAAKNCLSTLPAFTEVYNAIVDNKYTKHMPGIVPYLQGLGGKSPEAWAQALYDYAIADNQLDDLVRSDPSDGQLSKLTHILNSLTSSTSAFKDEKQKTLAKKLAATVSKKTRDYGRKWAGTLTETQMQDLITRMLEELWNNADKASEDDEVAQQIKKAFEDLGVRRYAGLYTYLKPFIESLAQFWYKSNYGQPGTWGKLAGWFEKIGSEHPNMTFAAKNLFSLTAHGCAAVISVFGIIYLADNWDTCPPEWKAFYITASAWFACSAIKGLVKQGIAIKKFFDADPLEYNAAVDQAFWERMGEEFPEEFEHYGEGLEMEAAEVLSKWKQFGKGFVNFLTHDLMTTFGAVVSVIGIVAMCIQIYDDFKTDETAAIKTLDIMATVCMIIETGTVFEAMAVGGEATVIIGALTVPVLGQIAGVLGLVFFIAEAIIKGQRLTPEQTWVENYGAPLLVKVPKPPQDWLEKHPDSDGAVSQPVERKPETRSGFWCSAR